MDKRVLYLIFYLKIRLGFVLVLNLWLDLSLGSYLVDMF